MIHLERSTYDKKGMGTQEERKAGEMADSLSLIHIYHGSYEGCYKCVEAGFSSIMFDGSHLPFEENVAKTKELIQVCAEKGMSLEAEVGSIGGEEDGVVGMGECADPEECKKIADLGVTMLAAGIGNIHGVYPENWKGLSFETLEAISKLTGCLLYTSSFDMKGGNKSFYLAGQIDLI